MSNVYALSNARVVVNHHIKFLISHKIILMDIQMNTNSVISALMI